MIDQPRPPTPDRRGGIERVTMSTVSGNQASESPSLYTKLYSDTAPRCPQHVVHDSQWRKDLPPAWDELVVAPAAIERFRQDDMIAGRAVGRDAHGAACYCTQYHVWMGLTCDDDGIFEEIPTYAESTTAWRLRDGNWLVLRRIIDDFESGAVRSVIRIRASMPR